MAKKEACELVLVNHPPGIASGCAICKRILKTGTWSVGLKIGNHRYAVGCSPSILCCGEEKRVIEVFDSKEEAKILLDSIREQLNHEGTTEGLTLYEFHPSVSDKQH